MGYAACGAVGIGTGTWAAPVFSKVDAPYGQAPMALEGSKV